jgi:hypothetical protein
MAKNIACFSRFRRNLANCYGKGIAGIILRRGHGQAYNQRCFVIKISRRKHKKRMNVAHLLSCLRIAINPDNVLPIRYPGIGGVAFC